MKTQRLMLTLEGQQYKDLKEMSEKTKVPVAAMIRRGVDLFIESKKGRVERL